MATVKGDVHDIGKNIVGVVLQCNNFDVIDMGVMVPKEKILDEAKKQNVDIIGLSGLITPSLDEMVDVAKEMQRRNMTQPLLIGGATTSEIHTAVKIDPEYDHSVRYVLDASRSVTVASSLLSENFSENFKQETKDHYAKMREDYKGRKSNIEYISLEEARNNKPKLEYNPAKPNFVGVKVFDDYSIEELIEYIDWSPFFATWEMKGRFPRIFENPRFGNEAKKLYDDALKMLQEIQDKKMLQAKGVIGIFPVSRKNELITTSPLEGGLRGVTFHFLRQQTKKQDNLPNISLADYIAPQDDYIGCFAVTAGIGIDTWIEKYEADHNDYESILLKALADRLAEAFAERMHQRVRKEFWGYASNETLNNDALVQEKYQGIRPAPGYPACPNHLHKTKIWELLNVEENTGIQLTENFAMFPTASVSGFYFAHPKSKYFGVGKVGKDQVELLATQYDLSTEETERWIGSNLSY